jgi:2-polyprenyl-6-methoxyphenol hydroxylase-like FAD-dependent oxidoreductase
MSQNSQNPDVLVVGGGMAGLAGALALTENGAKVTLVEQAPEFGEVGAGLQLAPNATRILKRWGLLDQVINIGVAPKHLSSATPSPARSWPARTSAASSWSTTGRPTLWCTAATCTGSCSRPASAPA